MEAYCDLPCENVSAPSVGTFTTKENLEDVNNDKETAAMPVFMHAKKLVAGGLYVPLIAVEIIIRA